LSSSTYVVKRYQVLENGTTKLDKSVVVAMSNEQLTAIQGFLQALGGGLKFGDSDSVMFAVSKPGEVEDIIVWSSEE